MGFILYTGQIVEALRETKHPRAEEFVAKLHELTDAAGTALAEQLNIHRMPLGELWDGHSAVSFMPAYPGQKLPEAIEHCDDAAGWE